MYENLISSPLKLSSCELMCFFDVSTCLFTEGRNFKPILKGQTLLLLAAVTCLLKNVKHANKHDFGSVYVVCML